MGVLRTNNNESIREQAKKYYDQLKTDQWNGTARDIYSQNNGRSGKERHQFGSNILSGIHLLGRFRQSFPKALSAAAYRYAPIINTTEEGKAAKLAIELARGGKSIAGMGVKSYRTYADRVGRVRNEIRKKYEIDYDKDKSYGKFNKVGDLVFGDYEDLIPVKFNDLQVRGIISGISDTINPTWNTTKYVGRPDDIVNYGGFSRDFTFSLKLAAVNPQSLRPMWALINEIAKFALPTIDENVTRYHGNLVNVTVGDMLKNELCAMTAYTLTPDENSYWEVLDPDKDYPSLTLRAPGDPIKRTLNLPKRALQRIKPRKKFNMPRVCDISISLKVLHKELPGNGGANLYELGKAGYDGKKLKDRLKDLF